MKSFTITDTSSGQRIDRYLMKLMPKAGKGFLQKMLRKKNIKLNGEKVAPNEMLRVGDVVEVFFSDETFDKFSEEADSGRKVPESLLSLFTSPVYEDENFIAISKPAGVLTQPDITGDPALSDAALTAIGKDGTFSPAPINRLDRGTTGLVLFPKNYQSQKRALSALRKKSNDDSSSKKVYYALVSGEIWKKGEFKSSMRKTGENYTILDDNGKEAALSYEPLLTGNGYTLLRVDLKTGRTHQIRIQMKENQTPIVGDKKYGIKEINEQFHLTHQLLHAGEYILEEEDGLLLEAHAPLPKDFINVLKQVFSSEDLEGLNQTYELL